MIQYGLVYAFLVIGIAFALGALMVTDYLEVRSLDRARRRVPPIKGPQLDELFPTVFKPTWPANDLK